MTRCRRYECELSTKQYVTHIAIKGSLRALTSGLRIATVAGPKFKGSPRQRKVMLTLLAVATIADMVDIAVSIVKEVEANKADCSCDHALEVEDSKPADQD